MRADLRTFYELLDELDGRVGRRRFLGECSAASGWPERGVYFLFEPGEERIGSGRGPRVVRVGTHALVRGSRATLWSRLRAHQRGNHRASAFRMLVGQALLRRDPGIHAPTWGVGSSRSCGNLEQEDPVERAVTEWMARVSVMILPVLDPPGPESRRADIERNSVALLAGGVDPPSRKWLGLHSPDPRICESGLWNRDFVGLPYDPAFLARLRGLVREAIEPPFMAPTFSALVRALLELVKVRVPSVRQVRTLARGRVNRILGVGSEGLRVVTDQGVTRDIPWSSVALALEALCERGRLSQDDVPRPARFCSAFLFALLAETLPEWVRVEPGVPVRLVLRD